VKSYATCRYFDTILKATPETVEDVMVEADGEWHTADNRYGTSEWKAQHPLAPTSTAVGASTPQTPQKPVSSESSGGNDKKQGNKSEESEIYLLDSDDEEEHLVKQELSPSFASASHTAPPVAQQSTDDVIDLTLDSDEEPSHPPSSAKVGAKRTASQAKLSPPRQAPPGKKMDIDRLTTPYNGPTLGGPAASYSTTNHFPRLPPLQPNLSSHHPGSPTGPTYRDPSRTLPRPEPFRINGSTTSWG
jgi:E3 SUMO-protein ligase PIAS1